MLASQSVQAFHQQEPVLELRALLNHALLGIVSADGVLLWERRSNQRFVLSWEQLEVQRQVARERIAL